MPLFDFVCDARIATSIEADSLEQAKETWNTFCVRVQNDDNIASKAGQFYVLLADEDPEVERFDGS